MASESLLNRQQLVTINLKYGSRASSLKAVAFAQLSAKALFLSTNPLTISELSSQTARIIGVKSVSEKLILKGLKYLEEIKKVEKRKDRWELSRETKSEIQSDIVSSNKNLDGVLKRHFPSSIERNTLRKWFTDASSYFFSHYGDEWVRKTCRGLPFRMGKPKTVQELIGPSIVRFKLSKESNALIEGFIGFLSSSDISDQQYLMSLGQAMFSARLVAAGIGVDPLSIDELKGAKLILDTNILFAVSLENSRTAKSLIALGKALKAINVELVFLHSTKEEYERALAGKKGNVMSLISTYDEAVLKDVRDDFISTAIARKCKSKEDYDRFFMSLRQPPKTLIKGYNINLEDYKDIEEATDAAASDLKLHQEIQSYFIRLLPRWRGGEKKSEAALKHDATLFHVVDLIRDREEKCWVMSLDRSLQAFAIDKAGPHGLPTTISVDALIEILAVNNAGPELEATNFAPLLANIILNECQPPANTYTTEDLHWLLNINERAADLPPDDTKKIIKQITRARMEGKTIDDTSLQLRVNRMFEEKRSNINQALEEAKDRVKTAESIAEAERIKREGLERQLIITKADEIRRAALYKFVLELVWRLCIVVLITGISLILLRHLFISFTGNEVDINELGNYGISLILFLLTGWKLLPKAVNDYRHALKNAEQKAKSELRNTTEDK